MMMASLAPKTPLVRRVSLALAGRRLRRHARPLLQSQRARRPTDGIAPLVDLIVFVVASAMVLGGAVGVVVYRHPVHAALSLVLTLFGVAVHFVALEAHFLAAVQVIVYAGAIVVLFLFVIMLLGVDQAEDLRVEPHPDPAPAGRGHGPRHRRARHRRDRRLPGHAAAARRVGLAVAADGAEITAGHDANIRQLAENLFSDNVFAFELTSVLLIVAVAGTVVLTRREKRRPTGDDDS